MNRVKYAARNSAVSLVAYIVQMAFSFASRTLFIYILGREILGLDSLVLSIIGFLALAELGINGAIAYSMYKPAAKGDQEKIKSLNAVLRKINFIIMGVILCIGLCVTPLVPLIAGDVRIDGINILYIYFMLLASSVFSYFSADKRILLFAHQQGYIMQLIKITRLVISNCIQIMILFLLEDYYLYVLLVPISTLFDNVVTYFVARQRFPFIKNGKAQKLDKETKNEIIKNFSASSVHRIFSLINNSMTNILIPIFLSLSILGRYANYAFIVLTITTLLSHITGGLQASIGNMIATESKEHSYKVFKALNLAFWLVSGWCAVCLICLLQPFINVWADKTWLLSIWVVIPIVVNFFVTRTIAIAGMFQYGAGLVPKMWWRIIVEVAINLGLGILFLHLWGIGGLFIATSISLLLTAVWMVPYIIFKHCFQKSVWRHFWRLGVYTAVTLGLGVVSFFVCDIIPDGFGFLFVKLLACSVITIGGYLLCFGLTKDFRDMWSLSKGAFKSLRAKAPVQQAPINENIDCLP